MFFKKQMRANDYDCDANAKLKPSAAMRYMQQTSAEHLISLGLPYDKLFAENMVFLMSKSIMKIHRTPFANEDLIVATAPVEIRGVRFLREFTIESMEGERLYSALTLWLLVNPDNRRILRPAKFPYQFKFESSQVSQYIGDSPLPKLVEENGSQKEIRVGYSHIDCNGHVNNSVYADFICDTLPYSVLMSQGIDTIIISFKSEAKWNEVINISAYARSSTEYYVSGKKGEGDCFESLVTIKNPQ